MADPQRGLPHVPDRWSLEAVVTHIEGQHPLFDVPPPVDDQRGFRGPIAATAAGISYRQLDYWARTGLVEPTLRGAHGSGSQRLYSFRDILALSLVKRLLDTGVSLANIRTALGTLRAHGTNDLAEHHPALRRGHRLRMHHRPAGHRPRPRRARRVRHRHRPGLDRRPSHPHPPAHRNPHLSGGGDSPTRTAGRQLVGWGHAPRGPRRRVTASRESGSRRGRRAQLRESGLPHRQHPQRQQQLGPHLDQTRRG